MSARIGYFQGAAALSVGVFALISPRQAANFFGVPLPAATPLESTPYVTAKGARDVTLGICYILFSYRSGFPALRTLMTAHIFTGIVDSVLIWKHGPRRKAVTHAAAVLGWALAMLSTVGFG